MSEKDIVAAVRSKYPTPLGDRHAAFLAEVATQLDFASPESVGLLKKTGGSVIRMPSGQTVSSDIITIHKGSELWTFDILGSSETTASPTWNRTKPTGIEKDLNKFYLIKAVDLPGDQPAPPPPSPVPPVKDDILTKVAEIEMKLDALVAEIKALINNGFVGSVKLFGANAPFEIKPKV